MHKTVERAILTLSLTVAVAPQAFAFSLFHRKHEQKPASEQTETTPPAADSGSDKAAPQENSKPPPTTKNGSPASNKNGLPPASNSGLNPASKNGLPPASRTRQSPAQKNELPPGASVIRTFGQPVSGSPANQIMRGSAPGQTPPGTQEATPESTRESTHEATQEGMPGDTPEIAPSLPVNSAPPSAGSQQTAPPDLLDRPPIPAPPAVTLIDPLNGGQAKPPLAWRSKAFKMQTTQATGVRTMKSVTAGQNDTLAALISAIQKAGLTVDSVFDPAGQVLAHSADPALKNINLIFALVPIDSGHVIVKAAVDPDSRAIKTNSLDDILTQMAQLVQNNRGML